MTIGWIEEWVNNGTVRDKLEFDTSHPTSSSDDSGVSDVLPCATGKKRKVREEDGVCVTHDQRDLGSLQRGRRRRTGRVTS